MLRGLFVNAAAERGGGEVILRNIVTNLDRSAFQPIVVFLRPGPLVEEFRAAGIKTYLFNAGRFRYLPRTVLTLVRLYRLVKQEKVDFVHNAGPKSHLYTALPTFLRRKPVILYMQDASSNPNPIERVGKHLPISSIIAISKAAQNYSTKFYAGRPCEYVWVGSDAEQYKPAEPDQIQLTRDKLGLKDGELAIGIFARLQRGKGLDIFIEAAALVEAKLPQARFFIVGGTLFGLEPELPDLLEAQIKRLSLQEHLRMLGHREDIPALMQAMDVVVSASVSPEGFGQVLTEAMLCGKPVVATAHGGSLDIVEDRQTGFLVKPGDPAELTDKLIELLENPNLRHELGQAGRARALKYFTVPIMVSKIEAIYKTLIKK